LNYIFSFLSKIAISMLLFSITFLIWKTDDSQFFNWLMPIIVIVWLLVTIFEGVNIKKEKKWFKEKEDVDERTIMHSYQAGYLTFWMNFIILIGLFFINPIEEFFFKPIHTVVILIILNILSYFSIKFYFNFYK